MSIMKKSVFTAVCVALAFVMVFSFAACEDENAGGSGRVSTGGDNEVLAVADGQDITRQQVDDLCSFMAMTYGMSMDDLDEANKTMLFNQMLIYVADNIIVKNYINESDEAAAEQAKESVDQQLEMFKTQSPDLEEQLSGAGITDDTVKTYLETQYYQSVLYEKVLQDQPVTDEEAQTYYDENKADFVTPESIGLSHILVSDAELTDAGRTSIEAIRQRVLDDEDFAELAKEFSDDGSAENGGDLGSVTRGMMVTPFEEAGFKLKKGEISDIVETEFGFHIIKANTDVIPEQQMTLESARENIDGIIAQQHFSAEIERLKAEHPVKYNVEVDPETGEPSTALPETTDSGVTEDAEQSEDSGVETE
ncbi:MAG: peptidylprolyl isomerase [Clostridiales Family XIII bacterium]|jgi:parvulin-like peptidyl-prolyl isomerase|nr:peptidylprolyl isomerase [Clostridiales Family XIII bacterium]